MSIVLENLDMKIELKKQKIQDLKNEKSLLVEQLEDVSEATAEVLSSQAASITKKIDNATFELIDLNKELSEAKAEELISKNTANAVNDEAKQEKALSQDLELEEKSNGENYEYTFKSFNPETNKIEKNVAKFTGVNPEWTPQIETMEFLKALKDNKMEDFKEKQAKFQKNTLINVVNTVAAAGDDKAGTAPGYVMGTGETANVLPSTPSLLMSIVESKIRAASGALWLVNGYTLERVWDRTKQFFNLVGGDGVAEAEVKPDFDVETYELRMKFKKYAGKWIITEEDIRSSQLVNEIINRFATLAAQAIQKQLDYDFLNGTGGRKIIGLADTTIRTPNIVSGQDFNYLQPRIITTKTSTEILNAISRFNPDLVSSDMGVKVLMADQYIDGLFQTFQTTGGTDQVVATQMSANMYNFGGTMIRTAREMFKNMFTNRIVGVVNMGGIKMYAHLKKGQNTPVEIKYDGGLSEIERNLYKYVAEIFVDLEVEDQDTSFLIKDNAAQFGTVNGTPTATTITFDVADGSGTAIADGKKFSLVTENGQVLKSGVASASGKVAFTAIPAGNNGANVYLINEEINKPAGLGKLGA